MPTHFKKPIVQKLANKCGNGGQKFYGTQQILP